MVFLLNNFLTVICFWNSFGNSFKNTFTFEFLCRLGFVGLQVLVKRNLAYVMTGGEGEDKNQSLEARGLRTLTFKNTNVIEKANFKGKF